MGKARSLWLIVNDASGSNSGDAVTVLKQSCDGAGFRVDRVVAFPDQPLPDTAELEAAGAEVVAVFAGDGTVNALIGNLGGWRGAVLVLPGGTMNLLFHRLHGERDCTEVVRLAAAEKLTAIRPSVIACGQGMALADLLAGPGTSWYEVREAMREADVLAAAGGAARAIGETLAAPGIACRAPSLGRQEGYPLVMLTPADAGIRVCGFHAETPAEFLQESWAVLRRRFREGPHDDLGLVDRVSLTSTDGKPFGLLLDGERAEAPDEQVFRLVPCAVDLLASEADAR